MLAVLIAYVVLEKPNLISDLEVKYFPPAPCSIPIGYKLGVFDTRFGISKDDFIATVAKSADLWNKGEGKQLLRYDPKGTLTINLVYDNRQQATDQNQVLQASVDKVGALASSVKAQYLSLENQYKVSTQSYKDQVALFQDAQSKYNADVSYWNSKGGAPKSEYQTLTAEKNNLISQQAELENKQVEVNRLADEINAFIGQYNLLVSNANSTIHTINSSAGEFEEGIYDPNNNQISIYQFDTKQRLFRVVAHELGHALGLDHNANPKSIMYSYNVGENEVLSKEDLSAIRTVCGKR